MQVWAFTRASEWEGKISITLKTFFGSKVSLVDALLLLV